MSSDRSEFTKKELDTMKAQLRAEVKALRVKVEKMRKPLCFARDRLVFFYGESPNTDFILAMDRAIEVGE